jgi:hypothetical protein
MAVRPKRDRQREFITKNHVSPDRSFHIGHQLLANDRLSPRLSRLHDHRGALTLDIIVTARPDLPHILIECLDTDVEVFGRFSSSLVELQERERSQRFDFFPLFDCHLAPDRRRQIGRFKNRFDANPIWRAVRDSGPSRLGLCFVILGGFLRPTVKLSA